MAEITCPMCGKRNPSDRQVCQFCEARLVPLIAETPPEAEEPAQPDEASPPELETEPETEFPDQEDLSPDWLSDLRADPERDDVPDLEDADDDFEDEEGSDWLSRLEGDVQEDDELLTEEHSPDFEQLADESQGEAEIPAWLQEMQAAQQESSEEPSEEAVESFEQDLDWLNEEAQPDSEDLPDWLSGVTQPDEEDFTEPAEDEVIPDWLREEAEDSAPGVEGPPEWLSEAAGEQDEAAVSQEELPDWLSEIPSGAVSEQFDAAETPGGEPVDELSSEDEALVPDSLSETPMVDDDQPEIEAPDEPSEFDAFDLETEIEEGESVTGELQGTEEPDEVYPVDLPDEWFPEELEQVQASGDEAVEPEISRAEIPSWLESMRPVEDAAPLAPVEEEDEQQVESAGPLAGLRGVLSAEPDIARVQKPPAYSIKLHVTENQHSHADLLKTMLAEEGQPQPIAGPAMISPQHLLRAVIGLLLIVAVSWPVLTGTQQAPLPTFAPETAAVNRLISQLPNQARVLTSFDYEPGLTGEMDAAAAAVVDHLMLRGAYLTLVSTSPTGPIVAERFLSNTQSEHNYNRLEHYINLGFISGGPAGLLSFAATPQRIMPYTLDGNFAWGENLPPLQGIERLADFDMVLVITDNPNVARIWVEQVQPYLVSGESMVPLVMVTSAQAEPLVRPYYQGASSQVQGIVSGLQGGGAYALLTGRGGLVRQYWDAFSLGLWVAAVLVVSGGVINIILVLLERSKKS